MPSKISPALEGEFEMIGIEPGPVDVFGIGVVDFRDTTLDMAERVYRDRLPTYLRRVKKSKNADRPMVAPTPDKASSGT